MDTCLVCEPLRIWLCHSQVSETLGPTSWKSVPSTAEDQSHRPGPSYWPARGAASPTTSGGSSSSSGSRAIGNEYLSSNHRDRSMVRQRSLQKGMAAVGLVTSNCLSQIGQSITSSLSSFRWDWQRDLTNQQASGRVGLKPTLNRQPTMSPTANWGGNRDFQLPFRPKPTRDDTPAVSRSNHPAVSRSNDPNYRFWEPRPRSSKSFCRLESSIL